MLGTIDFWQRKRGFGFIKPNDSTENVFCHISAFTEIINSMEIQKGWEVSYEIGTNLGRSCATTVKIISRIGEEDGKIN